MKRTMGKPLLGLLLLMTLFSIREIRKTVPERWVGCYTVRHGAGKQLRAGDTVSVDVPVVVPQVDQVPVVRIAWEPPIIPDDLDAALQIRKNTYGVKAVVRDFQEKELVAARIEGSVCVSPDTSWEEAPAAAIAELKRWLPFMREKELICYCQQAHGIPGKAGYYELEFYSVFHGIPYLFKSEFFEPLESEESPFVRDNDLSILPLGDTYVQLKGPGAFWATINAPGEVGIDLEDLPLLPFEEILRVLETRVEDGYAYSLSELRFGYMAFADPQKMGEEFILLPVWAAKGRTRKTISVPFDLQTAQAVLDSNGYTGSSIVINAQTGQCYDFFYDKRPDRRHAPPLLSWDEENGE